MHMDSQVQQANKHRPMDLRAAAAPTGPPLQREAVDLHSAPLTTKLLAIGSEIAAEARQAVKVRRNPSGVSGYHVPGFAFKHYTTDFFPSACLLVQHMHPGLGVSDEGQSGSCGEALALSAVHAHAAGG